MTPRWIAGLLVGGALVGAVAGWLRPIPPDSAAAEAGTSEWTLPPEHTATRTAASLFELALNLRWVGDVPPASEEQDEAAAVEWALRGILLPEAAILVQVGADPLIKRFGTGDILPDGSRVASVERDAVVLDRGGCHHRRSLYPSAPSEGDGETGCVPAGHQEEVPEQ